MPPILLLIPTEFEHAFVKERTESLADKHELIVAACGFGPVLPAAITTEKIHQHRPRLVILCGIAGAYERHRKWDGLSSQAISIVPASAM